jgi:predicted nucleic acid-binding protein
MFLLDTNVISEMRKSANGKADLAVQSWSDRTNVRSLYLSAITLLELEKGVLQRSRKDAEQGTILQGWLHGQVIPAFRDRTLAVDTSVALRCAALHVPATTAYYDGLIAATALIHGLTVVTRNVKHFEPMGVPVYNPWQE